MTMVYVVWESDGEESCLDAIFYNKTSAESAIRALKEQDAKGGRENAYHYWIQEKEVT
jgi:hypothetical protein